MTNEEIAAVFKRITALLEIKGENRFKVQAYQRAAKNIPTLTTDLSSLSEKELIAIPGIGTAIAKKIQELTTTGKLTFLQKLEGEIPPTLIDLLNIQDVGPKKAVLFWRELNITTIDELEAAGQSGKLRGLAGMGEKSEARILAGIETLKASKKRMPIDEALAAADEWVARLRSLPEIQQVEIAGSLRRWCDSIGDIDLVASTRENEKVMGFFTSQPEVETILSRGESKTSIQLTGGTRMQLWLQPPERFGSLLQFVIGSKAHNIRLREYALKQGLSLSEHGFVSSDMQEILCKEEEQVYRTLHIPFITPELREDRGEIQAASEDKLPHLVTIEDIHADLHMHTDWSDGKSSILEMAQEALRRGLQVIAIADHTPLVCFPIFGKSINADNIDQQKEAIQAAQRQVGEKLLILHGIEVDIRPDGILDFSDDLLTQFDLVVASLHSALDQPRETITQRLLNAINNPFVNIIAHPSGRDLPQLGAEADWDQVFKAAAKNGKILEINSHPYHLDLNDILARQAVAAGAKIAINTDSHISNQLANLKFGVAVARRAWLTKEDIISCLEKEELLKYLKR